MKKTIIRYIRLLTGLFLYGTGIVLCINANVGLAPWDAFHQGASYVFGFTMGQASIIMGFFIIVFNFIFHEKVGIGTVFNMIIIGSVIDLLMLNHIIPVLDHLVLQYLMILSGMFTIAFATFLYLGAGLGAGPRDGLMIVIHKRSKKSVRFSRNCIEITVLILGFFMGGHVGIGTVILSFGMGYATQFVFKIMKFNLHDVQHQYIDDVVRAFFRRLFPKRNT